MEPLTSRQQLELWASDDQPLTLIEHLDAVRSVGGDHRDPDKRSPVQIEMTGLGRRDLEAAAKLSDQRPYD